jgi:uncharacterized protein YegP (UPF0339 family)
MSIRQLAIASLAVVALSLTACASETGGDAESAPEANLTMAKREGGRFETFEGIDGKNYFRLVAANGLKLLRSEAYDKKAGPENAMDSLLKAGQEADTRRFQIVDAKDGGAYVNVTGAGTSTEIIATSEVYSSKSKAEIAEKTIIGYLKGIAKVEFTAAQTGKRFDLFKLEDQDAPRADGSVQPFKFLLRADNGETILMSEFYASKQAALDGIKAVKDYGRLKENFDVNEVRNGGVFDLIARTHSAKSDTPGGVGNSKSVGFSEVYANTTNAQRGADAVQSALQADVAVNDLSK